MLVSLESLYPILFEVNHEIQQISIGIACTLGHGKLILRIASAPASGYVLPHHSFLSCILRVHQFFQFSPSISSILTEKLNQNELSLLIRHTKIGFGII